MNARRLLRFAGTALAIAGSSLVAGRASADETTGTVKATELAPAETPSLEPAAPAKKKKKKKKKPDE
ncbi:MAG TPA: hypothetical protein VMS65_06450, partial [Polyangiaceae bacterium]|nr:hypothetical protein [Polyangiaceae bacterium]